jgi:hypothetical protein
MIKSSSRRMAGLVLALCSMVAAALLVPAAPAMAEACPNEQLRAEDHSTTLPDCRSYELVTPPFKEAAYAEINGSGGAAVGGLYGIAPDGLHVEVSSIGNFGDAKNGYQANSYWLSRTETGWVEENTDLPMAQFPATFGILANPELGLALYDAGQGLPPTEFVVHEAGGALDDLGPSGGLYSFQSISADFSHLLINAGPEGLQELIAGHEGKPVPVGVEPDGSSCAASGAGSRGTEAGHVSITPDGKTVLFLCSGKLFERIDNGEAEAHTVAISTGPVEPISFTGEQGSVVYSPDGSVVFYGESGALYRFDAPSGTREEVIPASAGATINVLPINETGEDGAYVYFDDTAALTGANGEGREPVPGEPNLYLLQHDAQFPGGRLSFIATTSPLTMQATPSGQFAVFASTADLTRGDTSTARQVFEYDAQTGSLVRVSIGQNGFNDNGNTDVYNAEIPEGEDHADKSPVVSDDGAFVAFQSADGLTAQAPPGFNSVYEYHDGNVYLISDGESGATLRGMTGSGGDIFFETEDQLVAQDVDTNLDVYDARVDGGFPAPVSLLPTCQGDSCQGPLSGAPVLLSPGSEFQAGGNPQLSVSEPEPAAKKSKPKAKPVKCKRGYVKKSARCVKAKGVKRARKASNERRAKS